MAVVIETTLGDITVDLYLEQRPVTCLNFLKLCKMKYYNFNLFHSIRNGFIAQTGDPTGEGSGGESIWGILEGPTKRFFSGEKMPKIRHTEAGLLSMVCTDDMMVGSQFFFTLAPDLDSLDGTHCVIGEVTEGHEVLTKLNEVICDETHRPYRDVRITHTVVLEDPFSDPPGLRAPSRSPSPNPERLKGGRIAPDEDIDETEGKTAAEIQEMIEEKEAKARATILEIVGDLPDADIAPPENVLFVCKLNPVTTDDDLEIIFSRFGKIVSCEVIRDKKTGNSLQYAFIEFDNKKSCEDAYFKMDNVLIDDRRIHVDFSQSVSKMRWLGKGRGVQYFNDDNSEASHDQKELSRRPPSKDRDRNRNRQNNEVEERRYHKDEGRYNNSRSDRRQNDRLQRDRSRSRSRHEETRSHRYKDRKQERNNYGNDMSLRERSRSQTRYAESRGQREKERKQKRNNDDNDVLQRARSRSRSRHDESRSHREKERKQERNHYDKSDNRMSDRHNNDYNGKEKSYPTHKRNDRNKNSSPKRYKDDEEELEHIKDKHDLKSKNRDKKLDECTDAYRKSKDKHKQREEPKTPSPTSEKKRIKDKNKLRAKDTKESKSKKRRKVSTSSDSSSESNSSTESSTTSSSESDRKKKKLRRKKRKPSTSSSSSSSSGSSGSSSATSSSSSSSESNKKRRKKKVQMKKHAKKSSKH